MGKHAVRQRQAKGRQRRRKSLGRGVVSASSVSMAGLLAGGLVLAPPTTSAADAATSAPLVHEDVSLAATLIFIDGHDYPDSGMRMLTELQGNVKIPNPNCTAPCLPLTQPAPTDNTLFVQYPATLGLLDGFTAPTGDQSVTAAQQGLEADLQSNPPSATNPVTVVGYSEGAVAASHEVPNWTAGQGVAFLLIGNPERPNGGILARFPAGTYIPFIGITAGNATQSGHAPVVMVTRQYDGVADAPVYIGNVLADLNAFLGFYYLHSTYYSVNPNAVPPNIVTTSPDGTMTDILVPAAPGALPILMPLAQAGVPQPVLVALDPAVRALIETGYNRTSDPSQQLRFALLPPPSLWTADAQSVAAGFALTAQELPAALAAGFPAFPALPTAPSPTPLPTAAPMQSSVPQTQLVSQLQPTSAVQHALTTATNTTGGSVVQQSSAPQTGAGTASAPKPTPSALNQSETVTTPPSTARTERTSTSSDPTAAPDAVTSDRGPSGSATNNAANSRSNSTNSAHPRPGKAGGDHRPDTSKG